MVLPLVSDAGYEYACTRLVLSSGGVGLDTGHDGGGAVSQPRSYGEAVCAQTI